MNVHFIIHEAYESPGACEDWVRDRGHQLSCSRVYAGDSLPETTDNIDLLIIMGGPQSPATTMQECAHFDTGAEQALIASAIRAESAVVGICLGSQLIGAALGARHARSPEKEIGKFPIELTPAGLANPKFAHFGQRLDVGHWHNDMPGLTPGATVIAASKGCPRQIIEYGDLVYGFQCHMELTPEVVDLLIKAETELPTWANHRFVQQPDDLRANDYREMNEKLFGFLDRLTEAYIQKRNAACV